MALSASSASTRSPSARKAAWACSSSDWARGRSPRSWATKPRLSNWMPPLWTPPIRRRVASEASYIACASAQAPLLVERHAEVGEDEGDGGLVAGLGEEVASHLEERDRLAGAAGQQQAVPLEHRRLRDDLGLSGLAPLLLGEAGGPHLGREVRQPLVDLRLDEVDARIAPRRRRQLAHLRHHHQGLGVAAGGGEAARQAQPILQVVGIEGPERTVELARPAPVLPRLDGAGLDRQPLLFRQGGRELDRLLRLGARPVVVAEPDPGEGQGGAEHRRVGARPRRRGPAGRGRPGDRRRAAGSAPRRRARAACGLPGSSAAAARASRRRGLGPAELVAQPAAGPRHQVEQALLGPLLGEGGHGVAPRRPAPRGRRSAACGSPSPPARR